MAAAVPFIATGVSVLSTAANVIQPIRASQAQNAISNTQSKIAEANAQQTEEEAIQKEEQQKQVYRQTLGKQRIARATSGIEEEGSPLDLFYAEKQNLQDSIFKTRYEGALQASRFRNQAALYQAEAKNRSSLARLQAGSNLLKGAITWLK